MTGKQRINKIFARQEVDRVGFWKGNPHHESLEKYCKHLGITQDADVLSAYMKDDLNWHCAEEAWQHPENAPMLDALGGKKRISLNDAGVFANTTDVKEVDAYPWPDVKHFNWQAYEKTISRLEANNQAVFGGMWSPFFHNVCDFFGMENYFCKMYTDPAVVEAVTEKLVDFYIEANEECFKRFADRIDVFFMGNDFGSQEDLLISPEMFRKFVLPGFKRLINLAKKYDMKVMLHSCGSIHRVIPDLIDAGVDGLHPLQAKAKHMDAQNLSQYKKDIIFLGGLDTQELLPFGKPDDIKKEVDRLIHLFGNGYILSPSHEALLPDVPIENVLAMIEAVVG